ncbi:MAG: caspase family protein [Pseudomonadota bacterium]
MVRTPVRQLLTFLLLCAIGVFASAASVERKEEPSADDLKVVDCALPGQLRRLGGRTTYLTARRPIRTTALECRVRGGEYVVRDEGNLGAALAVWMDRAQDGDPEAQTTLGEIFEQGIAGQTDPTTAARWYQKAAAQGSTRAMIALGNLYERGTGVPQDTEAALRLYRQASGLPDAVELEPIPDLAPLATQLSEERQALELETQSLANRRSELESTNTALEARIRTLERQLTTARQNERLLLERARSETDSRAAAAEELAQRRSELAQLESRMASQQTAIEERDALAVKNTELREQITSLEQQLGKAQVQQQTESRLIVELNRLKTELASSQTTLLEHTNRGRALEAELAQLKREAEEQHSARNRGLVRVTKATKEAAVAPPEIQLIEPAITGTTRGLVRISAPAAATSASIIGRVSAAAGLLSLTVNRTPLPTNDAGVFVVPSTTNSSRSLVLTAIDELGQRTDLTLQTSEKSTPDLPIPKVKMGRYHALLIANERYGALPRLNTPIADAARLEKILRSKYGFEVHTLTNATRYDILSTLNKYRESLTRDDNLLIYYAGHGELDRTNMRGYWLPVDAEVDSTANWLSNADITDMLNVMSTKHVMLVVDSCYSGTLTRSGLIRLQAGMTAREQATWLNLMNSKRARVVLTSGGLAPVLDFGGGSHSVFAKALLDTLESNTAMLPGRSLHQAVAARVAHAAASYEFEQMPEYAPISRAGHEAGDFVLLPKR